MRLSPPPPAGPPPTIAVVYNPATEADEDDGKPPSRVADAAVVEVARAVCAGLNQAGFVADARPLQGCPQAFARALRADDPWVVFNLVEAIDDDPQREPEFASALDELGLAFTGSRAGALALAQRKDVARAALAAHRIPIPAGFVAWGPADVPHGWRWPAFVKPAAQDGSIGVDAGALVHDRAACQARIAALVEGLGGPILVEAWLPGVELNVAVVPGPTGPVARASAIDFSACPPGVLPIVTYGCKWDPAAPEYAARSVDARRLVSEATARRAERVALAAFRAIGGAGYGRVDLRLDAQGAPRVIDVNPNPDLDPEAGYAFCAQLAGLDYPTLLARLVAAARLSLAQGASDVRSALRRAPHLPRRSRAAGVALEAS